MVASTILGLGKCGTNEINTGELGCNVEFGVAIHAIPLKTGTVISITEDLDLDFFNRLTQSDTAIPLMNAFNSETTVSDDTLETSPFGIEALLIDGLPKYSLTMKKGQAYYKELSKITGFGNYEFVLGDINGNWKFALTSTNDLKGFTAGQVIAMMTTPATPSETEKKTVTFQLTDRMEIDLKNEVILASNLFPITDVKGTNGVVLSYADASGAVPPAVLDVTLKVKAVFSNGLDTGIEGLVENDFLYTVDGTPETPTVVDDGDGFYTLTVTALAASTIALRNYDVAAVKGVALTSAGVLLRSNILSDVLA